MGKEGDGNKNHLPVVQSEVFSIWEREKNEKEPERSDWVTKKRTGMKRCDGHRTQPIRNPGGNP